EWWNYYGPQPNNAYLIDTDGSIFRHHDWLHRNDDDIYCDIDSLLGLPTNCSQTFGGSFTVQLMSNDTIWGDAGATITGHALLTNPTSIDCLVRIVKLQVNMPSGWTSSLCADVCYLPDVDTALVELPANSTMDFYYYFYSTGAGTGFTRVGFRNESDFNNGFQRNFWAVASEANGIDETRDTRSWWLAPNPAQSIITLVGDANIDGLLITDMQGRDVARLYGRSVEVAMLARGVYLVKPLRQGEVIGAARRLVKE
ncbi:MAG: hypothetical protein WAT74_16225, partial [Flavobacteriales bacterium]